MLYVFHGQNSFAREQKIREIKSQLGPPELLSLNTSVLGAEHLTVEELANTCDALPFLSERRLVIVHGLLARLAPRERPPSGRGPALRTRDAPDGTAQLLADLSQYLHRLPPTTVLILAEERPLPSHPLLPTLPEGTVTEEFPPLRGWALHQWVQEQVTQRGGSITPSTTRHLVGLVGNDQWLLASEIEKLALYCQGRPIIEADVRALVWAAKEITVFALVDAVAAGDRSGAMRALHHLLREGLTPPHMLAMLARQYRHLMVSQELLRQGLAPQEIGREIGLTSEFVLKRTLQQAQRHRPDQVRRAYQLLFGTDLQIKRGELAPALALELLILELCSESG